MGLSGGCACGAIRYQAAADPVFMLNCHCRDCQRASGSAYAAIMVFARGAVSLTGDPRWRTVTGDSGHTVSRGFCPDCGSPLCVTLSKLPDIFGVQAGSLDEPGKFTPAVDVFTASAQPWDHMDPQVPKKLRGTQG